ncbi:uncharacterized protein [Rutidosis leptorrhynchoides]|uniref:uncharacterized protein n=1 Tax=Rutidosis leptorrhynchoides TaxID=125765 RepID=UPI003A9A3D8E
MMFSMLKLQPLLSNSPPSNHQFGFYRCCEWKKRGNLVPNRAAPDSNSDYEIDMETAREALRKLDLQLDSISQKQPNPAPKTQASNPYDLRDANDVQVEDTGSFLPYAFFALLIFTIVYNIVFIKVIKPSVDGQQVELAPVRASLMRDILKAELLP